MKSKAIKIGDRVELVTFNCSARPSADIDPREDYWRLLGQSGSVIEDVPIKFIESDRILVRFDIDVTCMGLECHNELDNERWANALWIKRSDLRVI